METVRVSPLTFFEVLKKRRTIKYFCFNSLGVLVITALHVYYIGWVFYWPTFILCSFFLFYCTPIIDQLLTPYQIQFLDKELVVIRRLFGFELRRIHSYDRLIINQIYYRNVHYILICWNKCRFWNYYLATENNWDVESQKQLIKYSLNHPIIVLNNGERASMWSEFQHPFVLLMNPVMYLQSGMILLRSIWKSWETDKKRIEKSGFDRITFCPFLFHSLKQ